MRPFRRWPAAALLTSALLLVAPAAAAPADKDTPPALTAEDRAFLDGLVKDFLFDPRGAKRVRIQVLVRTVWASADHAERDGWLVAGQAGKPARVYFTDGHSVAAPAEKDRKTVDFAAECRRLYSKKPDKPEGPEGRSDRVFEGIRRTAVGDVGEPDLVRAAWLHRLGEDALAARALARVAKRPEAVAALRKDLAWSAFAGMVHAYMVRADAEALAHGERLLRLYPAEAKARECQQAALLVRELERRKKGGNFGRDPGDKWPEGFDGWPVKRKLAYLVEALEEVDARQWGQPGGVDLASDRRVAALIALGDAAVPALIDVVENDERLTRSVHFWRDFARSRTVLGVREAALTAVMSILRVRVFEPVATGDNFTGRGEEGAKATAARLRAYWKKYGSLPFDERMMKVLTDPKAKPEAWREAADNLADLANERTLGTTVWADRRRGPGLPSPAVTKFRDPTVAEATLAAMDRDLATHDKAPRDSLDDYRRRQIEDSYLRPLVQLGDKRLAAVLARRAAGAEGRMRRKWAYAAHWLGDPRPLAAFADDFRLGKVKLPADDKLETRDDEQPGTVELRAIVMYLASVRTPQADRALYALADPKHPAYALAARWIVAERPDGSGRGGWLAHPYCLAVLRQKLDDETPTGATWKIEGDSLRRIEKTGRGSEGIPELLRDPAARKESAPERVCDVAAERLSALVVGQVETHPLLKDHGRRLKVMKETFDRFQGRHRLLTETESEALGLSLWRARYVPDVRPLGRAATAEDVRAGRALFHLDGKGNPAELKLPAVATLKRPGREGRPARVLIVQAEVGPGGETTYGVLGAGEARAATEKELAGVKPVPGAGAGAAGKR